MMESSQKVNMEEQNLIRYVGLHCLLTRRDVEPAGNPHSFPGRMLTTQPFQKRKKKSYRSPPYAATTGIVS